MGVMVAGTGAILGHNWPLYFGFKGGKGALTSLAVVAMMDWRIALIVVAIFAVLVGITRYVSLGSVVGAAALPVLSLIFVKEPIFVVFAVIIGALAIFKHQANIKRLLEGTESKLGAAKH